MEIESIPGYRIVRPLGSGGAATVYLAVQESLEREVALKVIPVVGAETGDMAERFRREARTVAGLRHRNIVGVYDVGTVAGALYLSMEYLAGGSLRVRGPGGLDPDACVGIVADVASALQHAHVMGIVHRDIKPQNIMFREDGTTVLTDFGIAKVSGVSELTQSGTVLGTPYYMSPEQAQGRQVDGRSDLYSLGVVFYWMLTGHHPFTSDEPLGQLLKHITEPAPPLPPGFERYQPVVDRLLAKSPDARYQTGGELVEALDAVRAPGSQAPPARPPATRPEPAVPVPWAEPPAPDAYGGPVRSARGLSLGPGGPLAVLAELFRRIVAFIRSRLDPVQERVPRVSVPTDEHTPEAGPRPRTPIPPRAPEPAPPPDERTMDVAPQPDERTMEVAPQPDERTMETAPQPPVEATVILPPAAWEPGAGESGAAPEDAPTTDETRVLRVDPGTAHGGVDLPVALNIVHAREANRVGTHVPCRSFPFAIGRAEGTDLSFPTDPNLSRRHAEIDVDAEGFVIRDLGSSNGLYVNGRHLQGGTEPLLFGSSIALSRHTTLTFVADLPALPDLSGRRLADRYLLQERLHESIKAVTYLAKDVRLPRSLALKIFQPGLLRLSRYRGEFLGLAELAAHLQHPHIVRVLDFGEVPAPPDLEVDTLPYLCMEFMEGGNLARRLEENATPPLDDVTAWLRRLADALDHAHRNEVIHGDIKPACVVFDREGRPYLTDFAFASRRAGSGAVPSPTVLGSPSYMAPERWDGEPPSEASDQYSLAVLAYVMLTGTRPFEGQSDPEVRRRNFMRGPFPAHEEALRAGRENVSKAVTDVLARGLSVDPPERFESVLAFSDAFQSALTERRRDRPRVFLSYQRAASSGWAHHFRDKLEGVHLLSVFVDTLAQDGAPRIPDRLREEITGCDVFVCLLAPSTLASDWVRQEIRIAVESGKPMVPVFHEEFRPDENQSRGDASVDALLAYDAVHLLDRRNIHVEHTITELAQRVRKLV